MGLLTTSPDYRICMCFSKFIERCFNAVNIPDSILKCQINDAEKQQLMPTGIKQNNLAIKIQKQEKNWLCF